ncbi:UDP-glucose 4-epimerase GalE [Lysinibacter sp. HNR]|uniref:UDP-glucose 4-epimerase GalE n=1 Tax=Lysinibacter sp. HNR TaxID=3031408 RepID=UPI002435A5A5|nr:UDP-glucose 4-epimerase GalE [Lysinibacter sp. HNR]WGD36974.1 UDP-glucose 4-epimerase GalE [Lysinibacter sp. HNR]
MTWLITGGAGYIGTHVARACDANNIPNIILDDLSSGHREFVRDGATFIEGSILDRQLLVETMREHPVVGVIHIAGYKYAGESVRRPLHTYEQNVTGTQTLLSAMAETGVEKIVFSSSAAVYGTPRVETVTEETAKAPESPYGESKLIGEWLLHDQGIATGLAHTSLRYFNVVGTSYDDVVDTSPHNLFPLIGEALRAGRTPKIFGNDYNTPDGTCVRDYIHVSDLADSHIAAARALQGGTALRPAYNLGSGDGASVGEIMRATRRMTGVAFEPEVSPRRPGDPDRIVASGEAAARDLGWRMRFTLDEMISSDWNARLARG